MMSSSSWPQNMQSRHRWYTIALGLVSWHSRMCGVFSPKCCLLCHRYHKQFLCSFSVRKIWSKLWPSIQQVWENPIRRGPWCTLTPFNFGFMQRSLHLCVSSHAVISAGPWSQKPVSLACLLKEMMKIDVLKPINIWLCLRIKQDHRLVWINNTCLQLIGTCLGRNIL